jgi:hypothetical protein
LILLSKIYESSAGSNYYLVRSAEKRLFTQRQKQLGVKQKKRLMRQHRQKWLLPAAAEYSLERYFKNIIWCEAPRRKIYTTSKKLVLSADIKLLT